MGAFLDKPRTEKSSEQGGGLGLRYGVCSMQGWRTEMEDAHSSRIGLPLGFDDWSFFAVFDGHAGKKVSALAADNLIKSIFVEGVYPHDVDPTLPSMEPDGWKKLCDDYKLQYPFDSETEGRLVKHFKEHGDDYHLYKKDPKQRAYEVGEDGCQCLGPRHPELNQTSLTFLRALGWYLPSEEDSIWMVKEAIRRGFLSLDDRLRDLPDIKEGQDRSGSTAVCAIISPEHIYLANCGDSRAIMCRDDEVVFETQDHKPADSRERKRIVEAGGTVMIQRVNGSLAVSRALGDYEYKNNEGLGPCQQLVSPEPDVHAFQRKGKKETKFSRDATRCEVPTADPDFIVLACDGIWDVMSSDEVCKFVSYLLKVHDDLEYICATVIDTCLHKGSRDNMTLVIVVFPRAPKKSKEWAANDLELDNAIVDYLTREINPHLMQWSTLVNHIIAEVSHKRLPPGGGIESKFRLIEETLLKLKPDARDSQTTKSDDEIAETQECATSKPTEQKEEPEEKEDKEDTHTKEEEKEKESTLDMAADISQSKR